MLSKNYYLDVIDSLNVNLKPAPNFIIIESGLSVNQNISGKTINISDKSIRNVKSIKRVYSLQLSVHKH